MKKITNEYETFYFGNYQNISTPIAVSNVKDLVKEYMEVHRGLNPNEYTLSEGYFKLSEVQLEYPYSLIEPYEEWYIPVVDAEMIEVNKNNIEETVNNTISGLKLLAILVQDIKKIPESDRAAIINAMRIINSFKNKRKIWNKIIDNFKLSELLFMDMDAYWSSRCMYIDMKETRQRWDFMIENKGGDEIGE